MNIHDLSNQNITLKEKCGWAGHWEVGGFQKPIISHVENMQSVKISLPFTEQLSFHLKVWGIFHSIKFLISNQFRKYIWITYKMAKKMIRILNGNLNTWVNYCELKKDKI